MRLGKFPIYRDPSELFPAILATNKLVYHEALDVLYSRNVLRILCPHSEMQRNKFAFLELPRKHPLSLVVCENDSARAYVRRAFAELQYEEDLQEFIETWTMIEPVILDSYPNIEQFTIGLYAPIEFTITMRRQPQKPNFEPLQRLQHYLGSLQYVGFTMNRQVEDLCKAIMSMRRQGPLQETTFGIQAINWWDCRGNDELERTAWLESGICVSRNHRHDSAKGERAHNIRAL